jgi:hypothetical protein
MYNPGSFAPRPLTGGSFNQMAQQAAGPLYIPQAMQARGMAGGGVGAGIGQGIGGSASGGGGLNGATPPGSLLNLTGTGSSGAPAFFGGTPANAAQMLAALLALQGMTGQAPYKQTGAQVL